MTRPAAVLDTSFWCMGYRAEICANLLDLFDVIPPAAVECEIYEKDPRLPTAEFPYATLYRRLRSQMTDPPEPEPEPIDRFGAGEAAAIALAKELNVSLLINERKGAEFARSLGLTAITVPSVIVALYAQRVISDRAACRKLELVAPNTAQGIIQDALAALRALGASCT